MTTPRPLSEFFDDAVAALPLLRKLVVIEEKFCSGCGSLSDIADLADLPKGYSMAALRKFAKATRLLNLLKQSFGRTVTIYLPPAYRNGPFTGLSQDGLVAARLAREFIAFYEEMARRAREGRAR